MTLTAATPTAGKPAARLKIATDVKRTDFVLVGAALLLSIIGAALIFSATRGKLIAANQDPRLFLDKQMINIVIGVILGWSVSSLGYRTLRASAWWVYAAAVLLLMVVLTPVGTTLNGVQGWITLPAGFTVQPSEFAKVAVILAVSLVLTQLGPSGAADADVKPRFRYVLLALLIAGIPVTLIMIQPDLGTALVIVATVFGMLAVSGVASTILWSTVALAALVGFGVIRLGLLEGYQIDRLLIFMDPEADPLGAGYNTRMARIAIAGGGLLGYGLFRGPTTQGGFVPYQQTDFIFSAAGEELGLVGAGLIILLVGVILWRGVRISLAAPDRYGRVMAAGVVVWLAVQSFENIGMNLGIMPVTGVPLPFVSYGGSSMFVLWIAIGLLTSVHLRSTRPR